MLYVFTDCSENCFLARNQQFLLVVRCIVFVCLDEIPYRVDNASGNTLQNRFMRNVERNSLKSASHDDKECGARPLFTISNMLCPQFSVAT